MAAKVTIIPALKNSRPRTIFRENSNAFGAHDIGKDNAIEDETAVTKANKYEWLLRIPTAIGRTRLAVAVSFMTVDIAVDITEKVAINTDGLD